LNIGLYGGTFDPIHNGHCHLIQQLLNRKIVDELVVTPVGNPWMREQAPFASGEDRLAMVRLAIGSLPTDVRSCVTVSDSEVRRVGNTYTIDTVLEVKAAKPEAEIVLILGSDAYSSIGKWHRSAELLGLVRVFVVAREGVGFDIDALAISSTIIREKILSKEDISTELPESVWSYIKERNLYASK
jgi:nicotinate-nucleotide adenylyltransferase